VGKEIKGTQVLWAKNVMVVKWRRAYFRGGGGEVAEAEGGWRVAAVRWGGASGSFKKKAKWGSGRISTKTLGGGLGTIPKRGKEAGRGGGRGRFQARS